MLEEMIYVPGVSGYEEEIREHIRKKIAALGVKTTEDTSGTSSQSSETRSLVMFIAHMDELGLIVTKIEEDGSLRIRKVGGVDDRSLVGAWCSSRRRRVRSRACLG